MLHVSRVGQDYCTAQVTACTGFTAQELLMSLHSLCLFLSDSQETVGSSSPLPPALLCMHAWMCSPFQAWCVPGAKQLCNKTGIIKPL